MSYELLTSLYFGEGANADLTSRAARALLHVPTPLEQLVPAALRRGLDVVLTGNPGDGKSHLVRTLQDEGQLGGAEVLLDLSARPTAEVVATWASCRKAGKRFVLCGNEGPLGELIDEGAQVPALRTIGAELREQLRKLVVSERSALPRPSESVMLIDLADRSVLDERLVIAALTKVSSEDFLPNLGELSTECSAGRNLLMLQDPEVRARLARMLVLAGRRSGEHVTFRQLWAAIAYAVCAAKAPSTLRVDYSRDQVGLGTTPLDNLANPRASGLLIDAARRFADPSLFADPGLDEALWTNGEPEGGRWLVDMGLHDEPPARRWARGEQQAALRQLQQLKRFVALAHEQGAALVEGLARSAALPSSSGDAELHREVLVGLRRFYVSAADEDAAPAWLIGGLPLWLEFTYEETPTHERPHVAVRALADEDFEIKRPLRAPWLADALGPPPEVAWLQHRASGVSLRVDPELLAALRAATTTAGPLAIPEPIQRFLIRLAGWDEETRARGPQDEDVAIIERPRGALVAAARVRSEQDGAARYV